MERDAKPGRGHEVEASGDGERQEEGEPPEEARQDPLDDGRTAEQHQSLWLLAASPTIWAAHFLASYITGAIWCAKGAGPSGDLGWVRTAVAIYTAVALIGIVLTGAVGWRRHSYGSATVPHDFDTRADRHRFLGFATVLLSALSALAVLYVGSVALFFRTCR